MQTFQRLGILSAIILSLVSLRSAQADVPAALGYVNEAKGLVERRDFDSAQKKLELAEAELEGVTPADKAPIAVVIEGMKKQIGDAQLAGDKQKYTRELDRVMRELEDSIGNLVTWQGNVAKLRALVSDPRAKAALGDELAKAQAKFATFQKLHAKKASAELGAGLDADMKTFEAEWAENKPKLSGGDENQVDNATRSIEQSIARLNRRLEGLPADDPAAVAARTRIAAITQELNQLGAGAGANQVVARLRRSVELYEREWQGWDMENTAPTWDEYKSKSGDDIDRFSAPKSVAAWQRLDSILKDVKESEAYQAHAASPAVKAEVAKLQTMRDAAYAKVLTFATAVVAGAEAAPVDQQAADVYARLSGGIGFALGDFPQSQALSSRVAALQKKYTDQTEGAQKAAAETSAKLTAAADKAWPDMVAKFNAASGFDPSTAKAGSYYRIQDGANRMGWDFKPENGGFDFAMKVNGQPLAGNYHPTVKAAIEDVQKQIKQDIEDRGWDFVVLYEGKQGKVQMYREGSVQTTSGQEVGTYREAVTADAPIVQIVALRSGPLAAAAGQGVVNTAGTVGAVNTASVAGNVGAGGWMSRLFYLLVGLLAAFVCLMKARFAPLVANARVGQMQTTVGDRGLSIVGLACGALGLYWFVTSLISFSLFGILVTLAIIAAGLFAALDLFSGIGVVKPELEAKLKPLGIPVGLACAVLVILSLFI